MISIGKPAVPAVAATSAKLEPSASRKSGDELRREDTSSSSSDGEDKKAKKHKSRSVSRKRGSLFGSLLGKKEPDEKKAEIKDEKTDAVVAKSLQVEGDSKAEIKPAEPSFDAAAVGKYTPFEMLLKRYWLTSNSCPRCCRAGCTR